MHTEQPARDVLISLQQFQDTVFANVAQKAHFIFSKNVSSPKNGKIYPCHKMCPQSRHMVVKANRRLCR